MFKKKRFQGKTALISGAGSGIGFELALELASQGADIIATDLAKDRLDDLVRKFNEKETKIYSYVVNHADKKETDLFVDQILETYKQVDILCCNAGIVHFGKLGEFSIEQWKRVVDIDYWGQVFLIDRFMPLMQKNKEGWILITASGAGLFPLAGMAPYCTTKAAMVSLANIMQMELRRYNINVSALCPGVISTNIMRNGDIQGQNNQQLLIKMYDKLGTHPRKVAKAGVKGLWRNKAVIRVPLLHNGPIHFIYKMFPMLLLRMGSLLFNRGWNFIGPILK